MYEVVAIDQIQVSEDRQRKAFPEDAMLELRESIFDTDHGLLQPLLVRPNDNDEADKPYILVAGERRLRAIERKKQPYMFGDLEVEGHYVPVIVKNFISDLSAEEAELHENIYRLNLTWQEQALAISKLHKFKVARNPKHGKGMTAQLIEPGNKGDYAGTSAYRKVQQALLVEDFIEDEDVKKANSLWDASRVVSKKIEDEALERLSKTSLTEITSPNAKVPDEDLNTSLDNLLADAGPLPELPEQKPKREGTLHVGNCLEIMDKLEQGSIDIVIADPPYGVNADEFKDFGSTVNEEHQYKDDAETALHLYHDIIQRLDRVCSEHAHVYLFCDATHFGQIKTFFSDSWRVRNAPLTWRKGSQGTLSEGVGNGWTRTTEFIVVATRGSRSYGAIHGDCLDVPRVRDKKHGAEKPMDLYVKLLEMSGLPDDVVLDPCCGSGTIFPAAYKKFMKPIGIELIPRHAIVAEERRKQLT